MFVDGHLEKRARKGTAFRARRKPRRSFSEGGRVQPGPVWPGRAPPQSLANRRESMPIVMDFKPDL